MVFSMLVANFHSIFLFQEKVFAKACNLGKEMGPMKTWVVLIIAMGLQISVYAIDDSVRTFRAVDPNLLDRKVPRGYGKVFVEAGRQYHIDPLILAAISAHESGAWKSHAARFRNNWMGLMARRQPKKFATPAASIFYAAELLNRKPFIGHSTLASIAPLYCAANPANWKKSVLRWRSRLMPR
jgi:hypothetical protein